MSAKNLSIPRHTWLSDSLILIILIGFYYCLFLGSYPVFTPDEGRYSEVAREMIATHDYLTPRVNGVAFLDKPILYYWLQVIAIQLFGMKEWALRLFPMLLGLFNCLNVYLCGRYLFNRRTGLLAAMVLASTPLYFGAAHYADLNLEVAVWISSTLLFFLTAIYANRPAKLALLFAAYTCSGLAVLTKGLIGAVLPGMIGLLWLIIIRRLDLLKTIHLLKGLLWVMIICLPWYILVEIKNPGFFHYFFLEQQVARFLSANQFNNPSPIWFYVPIILIGFFPWTIFLLPTFINTLKTSAHIHTLTKEKGPLPKSAALVLFAIWTMVTLVFFSIPHSKTIGYILPILPPLALLTGNYLSLEWDLVRSRYAIVISFIVMCLLLSTLLFYLPQFDWIEISTNFNHHLWVLITIFLISASLALLTIRAKQLLAIFVICLATSVFSLLSLVHGAKYLHTHSAKLLVMKLKPILQVQDEVIAYFKYYQDVPLYLGQRITIAADWQNPNIAHQDNWQREFWYGLPFQDTHTWLINEKEFWQRFNGKKRVFVFLNENYFLEFAKKASHYFLLGKENNIILLSNQNQAKT